MNPNAVYISYIKRVMLYTFINIQFQNVKPITRNMKLKSSNIPLPIWYFPTLLIFQSHRRKFLFPFQILQHNILLYFKEFLKNSIFWRYRIVILNIFSFFVTKVEARTSEISKAANQSLNPSPNFTAYYIRKHCHETYVGDVEPRAFYWSKESSMKHFYTASNSLDSGCKILWPWAIPWIQSLLLY